MRFHESTLQHLHVIQVPPDEISWLQVLYRVIINVTVSNMLMMQLPLLAYLNI